MPTCEGRECCESSTDRSLGNSFYRLLLCDGKGPPRLINVCKTYFQQHQSNANFHEQAVWEVSHGGREARVTKKLELGKAFSRDDPLMQTFFKQLAAAGKRESAERDVHDTDTGRVIVPTHTLEQQLLNHGGGEAEDSSAAALAVANAMGKGSHVLSAKWELEPRPEPGWVQEMIELLDPIRAGKVARVYSVPCGRGLKTANGQPRRRVLYDIELADTETGKPWPPPTASLLSDGNATFVGVTNDDVWLDEGITKGGGAGRDVWRTTLTDGGGVCQLVPGMGGRGSRLPPGPDGITYFWSQDMHGAVAFALRVPTTVVFDVRTDVEVGRTHLAVTWRQPQHIGPPFTLSRALYGAVNPPRRGDVAARVVHAPDASYAVIVVAMQKTEFKLWPAFSPVDEGRANASGAHFFPGDTVVARGGWIVLDLDEASSTMNVRDAVRDGGHGDGHSAYVGERTWVCPYGTSHGDPVHPDECEVEDEVHARKSGSAATFGHLFLRAFLKVAATSLLLTAVKCAGDASVVEALLRENGVPVSVADSDTRLTPLMAACEAHLRQPGETHGADAYTLRQLDQTVRLLLSHANASLLHGNFADERIGETDVDAQRETRSQMLAQVLNAKDGSGNTALHYACWAGRLDAIQLLLDPPNWDDVPGASLFSRDMFGRTPMHAACWQGHDLVACMLLRRACTLATEHVTDFGFSGHFSATAAASPSSSSLSRGREPDYLEVVCYTPAEVRCCETHSREDAPKPRWRDHSWNRDGVPCTRGMRKVDVNNLDNVDDAIDALLNARASCFAYPIHMAGMSDGATPIDFMINNNHEVASGRAPFVLSYKNPYWKTRSRARLWGNPNWEPCWQLHDHHAAFSETPKWPKLDWVRHLNSDAFDAARGPDEAREPGHRQIYLNERKERRKQLAEDGQCKDAVMKIMGEGDEMTGGGWEKELASKTEHADAIQVQKEWLTHLTELDCEDGEDVNVSAQQQIEYFKIVKDSNGANAKATWWQRPDDDSGAMQYWESGRSEQARTCVPFCIVPDTRTTFSAAETSKTGAMSKPTRCLAYHPASSADMAAHGAAEKEVEAAEHGMHHARSMRFISAAKKVIHTSSQRSSTIIGTKREMSANQEEGMFYVVNGVPGSNAEKHGCHGERRMFTFCLYPCVAQRFRQIITQRYIDCFVPKVLRDP